MSKAKQPSLEKVTTINDDGSRFRIHPADVKGRFVRWRRIIALLLIGIYVLLPWIPINGNPAIFLDVINRRFHLFGITLAAQDAWLLFFALSGMAFLLFYLTAFVGRVWCGWACPQTVFLEHVFRRVERWIDGDSQARKQLDRSAWTPGKIIKRVLKESIFILLSATIAHVFISYFISIPQLWSWMHQAPTEHWTAFLFVFAITAALYVNFSWFREQLCIVICPYGRFQSALIDENSLNVAYDYQRGNPPGPVKDPDAGDCIDCHRCVQVCPTGIDIRQGLQLECIACTACIDACDDIMDKVNRPRGLIRYASENQLERKTNRWLRPRTILYSALLLLGMSVAMAAFSKVEPFIASVTRMPGSPFYLTETTIRNQYEIRLINKTTSPQDFLINAHSSTQQNLITSGTTNPVHLKEGEEKTFTFVVQVHKAAFVGNFNLEVFFENPQTAQKTTRSIDFIGPDPTLLQKSLNP